MNGYEADLDDVVVSGVESAEFGTGHIGVVSQIQPGSYPTIGIAADFNYNTPPGGIHAGRPVMVLPCPMFQHELTVNNTKNYQL